MRRATNMPAHFHKAASNEGGQQTCANVQSRKMVTRQGRGFGQIPGTDYHGDVEPKTNIGQLRLVSSGQNHIHPRVKMCILNRTRVRQTRSFQPLNPHQPALKSAPSTTSAVGLGKRSYDRLSALRRPPLLREHPRLLSVFRWLRPQRYPRSLSSSRLTHPLEGQLIPPPDQLRPKRLDNLAI